MKTPEPAISPQYQALLQLLRTADTIWDASREFFAPWDLSPSQFNVLNLLRGGDGGTTQIELSRQLIVHRSNITGLVDRLEKRGLVCRNEVPGDRRSYRVALTREGERVMAEILPQYYAAAHKLWEGLRASDLNKLTNDLREAARRAERIARETNPQPRQAHENKTGTQK